MRWFAWCCALVLVASGAAMAHDGHGKEIQWDLALRDRDCQGNATLCFLAYMKDPVPVHAGQILVLLLRNDNDLDHQIRVTYLDNADPNHEDTTVADPLAASHELPRGQLAGTSFVVPLKARDLYIWCDTPGHEAAGMWMNATILPPEDKDSPFAVVLVVSALGVAALRRRMLS